MTFRSIGYAAKQVIERLEKTVASSHEGAQLTGARRGNSAGEFEAGEACVHDAPASRNGPSEPVTRQRGGGSPPDTNVNVRRMGASVADNSPQAVPRRSAALVLMLLCGGGAIRHSAT